MRSVDQKISSIEKISERAKAVRKDKNLLDLLIMARRNDISNEDMRALLYISKEELESAFHTVRELHFEIGQGVLKNSVADKETILFAERLFSVGIKEKVNEQYNRLSLSLLRRKV